MSANTNTILASFATETEPKKLYSVEEVAAELSRLSTLGFKHHLSTVHEEHDKHPEDLEEGQAAEFVAKGLTIISDTFRDVFRTQRRMRDQECGWNATMYRMSTY